MRVQHMQKMFSLTLAAKCDFSHHFWNRCDFSHNHVLFFFRARDSCFYPKTFYAHVVLSSTVLLRNLNARRAFSKKNPCECRPSTVDFRFRCQLFFFSFWLNYFFVYSIKRKNNSVQCALRAFFACKGLQGQKKVEKKPSAKILNSFWKLAEKSHLPAILNSKTLAVL